jgi:hypothetical protein
MNSTFQRTRVRLLASVSGAVALSVLAVAGCSSSSSSTAAASSTASAGASAAASSAAKAARRLLRPGLRLGHDQGLHQGHGHPGPARRQLDRPAADSGRGTATVPSDKASPRVQAEAKQFIAFVLSPAGQKVMQSGDPTGDSLYCPVLSGVSPLSSLPSLASVKTQTINPYTWGPQEAAINNWFDANIVR